MIWFFERHQSRLQYEIRRQTDGLNYELVITFPDGRQEIERYDDPTAVRERAIKLERTLTDEGWEPPRVGPGPSRRSPNDRGRSVPRRHGVP
jgi:hypothetical protein